MTMRLWLLWLVCGMMFLGCAAAIQTWLPPPFCLPPSISPDFLTWAIVRVGSTRVNDIVGIGIRYEHAGQAVLAVWKDSELIGVDLAPDDEAVKPWIRTGGGCQWTQQPGRGA